MFIRDGTETPRRQWSIRTDLLEPAILLHQRRKHAGAAAWRGLHIVVTEAAEEGAEDAAAPLLLQANVAPGGWGEKQGTARSTVICDARDRLTTVRRKVPGAPLRDCHVTPRGPGG